MHKAKVGDNGQIELPAQWLEKQEVKKAILSSLKEWKTGG